MSTTPVVFPAWLALCEEAGPEKAAEIAAAAVVVLRALRQEEGHSGQGQVRLIVRHGQVLRVERWWETVQRGPG